MAKMLLSGAVLLAFLELALSDPECDVDVGATYLEYGRVKLRCSVTGNATSLVWTQNGQRPPVDPKESSTVLLLPSEDAKGYYECQARCGDSVKRAGIRLGGFKIDNATRLVLTILLGVVLILVIVVPVGCYYRRLYRVLREAQENAFNQANNGQAIPLADTPLM